MTNSTTHYTYTKIKQQQVNFQVKLRAMRLAKAQPVPGRDVKFFFFFKSNFNLQTFKKY